MVAVSQPEVYLPSSLLTQCVILDGNYVTLRVTELGDIFCHHYFEERKVFIDF